MGESNRIVHVGGSYYRDCVTKFSLLMERELAYELVEYIESMGLSNSEFLACAVARYIEYIETVRGGVPFSDRDAALAMAARIGDGRGLRRVRPLRFAGRVDEDRFFKPLAWIRDVLQAEGLGL